MIAMIARTGTLVVFALTSAAVEAQPVVQRAYYAHDAVHDGQGVIAPWYAGQNGQCDLRVRIAAETLKRYPWAAPGKSDSPGPQFVFNGRWAIARDGTITVPECGLWENGDLGQRAAYVISGLVDYYRYSGDATVIGLIALNIDYLLDHCQTPADHPWPRILVSCPTKGIAYRDADPRGFIQLDIVAETGLALVRAYELTGSRRWLDAAKHWADLLAEKRDRRPGAPPWPRYANSEDVPWEDIQTGGVAFILAFLDELISVGYTGDNGALLAAREAGVAYLRDYLLPRWTINDTWGRNYWDWNDPVQAENVTEYVARYLIEHPTEFPSWRADARNVMSLFLNRTSVSPYSNGDVYSGAWAYPESSGCCGRSLWYGPMELATVWAEYGVAAESEWAREMARRQMILATYDVHETGVVEDNIDGGPIVAGEWFKIAHPMALKHVLGTMAWLPDVLGAAGENHIMRTSSVVREVRYRPGEVSYRTFDAEAPAVDVLRLAFDPASISAGGRALTRCADLSRNGFRARRLPSGDYLVEVRHDGQRDVVMSGPRSGCGSVPLEAGGSPAQFNGNQVRIIGDVGPSGGLADVFLDGEKQLCGIDFWCPQERRSQVVWYLTGLPQGRHTVQVVPRGEGNPVSRGGDVWLTEAQWSSATAVPETGEGGGPRGAQRVILGYAGSEDYVDSGGNSWRPATEVVTRLEHMADSVAKTWWTERRRIQVEGTPDPELYRYGIHAQDFTLYFTVGPGTYHARIKLCETTATPARSRALTVEINAAPVATDVDVSATAGGIGRASDLVYDGIAPSHGVIALRFRNTHGGEAAVQAVEIGPGPGGPSAQAVCLPQPERVAGNLLANPGFESTAGGQLGRLGREVEAQGWQYLFAGPTQSYIWAESDYSIHPDWGLPETRSGKQAIRTHTEGDGHTLIYQEARVAPGVQYRASVWAQAVDLHGKGFGTHSGDRAALRIQEIDAGGNVVADHPPAELTAAAGYTELVREFTATEGTAKVRFILETVIGCPYNEGHVTYDDCELAPR